MNYSTIEVNGIFERNFYFHFMCQKGQMIEVSGKGDLCYVEFPKWFSAKILITITGDKLP